MSTFDPLPGFRDFYPEECQIRNYLFSIWRQVARRHNFAEYATPTLQRTDIFIEKSGPEIVGQLFNFKDKGEREVTLPPEVTPYVAQMVGAKASALKRPIRWFSIPQCFRYERMQKGRGREFYQLNYDIFDEAGTTAEVEILALTIDIFKALGLTVNDFAVRLSDRTLWLSFLEGFLGQSRENALKILQIIDKWDRDPAEEIKNKLNEFNFPEDADYILKGYIEPSISPASGFTDILYLYASDLIKIKSFSGLEDFANRLIKNAEKSKAGIDKATAFLSRLDDWRSLLADLSALGLADFIQVDLGIVRGLAYYTGFVFEVFEKTGQGRALAGGGRFDTLVKKLGGPDMPAVGCAMSDVATLPIFTEKGLLPKFVQSCDLYLVYTSDTTRARALQLLPQLRQAGFSVEVSLKPLGFGKQMKQADKAGARKAVIIGDDELAKGICKLKCLTSGEEREVALEKLVDELRSC